MVKSRINFRTILGPYNQIKNRLRGYAISRARRKLEKENQLTENDLISQKREEELKRIAKARIQLLTEWLPTVRVYLGGIKEYSETYGPVEEIPRDPASELVSIDTRAYNFFSYGEEQGSMAKYRPVYPNHYNRSFYDDHRDYFYAITRGENAEHRVLYPMEETEILHDQGLVAIVNA